MFNLPAIKEQSEKYDSFYLYEESIILSYTQMLRRAFENVDFLYSIKANPHPLVVKTVFSQGFGADAASLNEVLLSSSLGLPKEKILYSAPGKSKKDISEALGQCVLIADSLNEIRAIDEIAQQKGITAEIGIRINPDFTFYSQTGTPSKFGIDEKVVFENASLLNGYQHVQITGIHVHSRSQELKAELILGYYENMLAFAEKAEQQLGITLQYINMGSGIGVPYAPDEKPIDIDALGKEASKLFCDYHTRHKDTNIIIETGRFAVCKCGVYATKVLDKKTSYGKTFVLLSNTLNGFIKPSLAQIVSSYTSDEKPASSEPLFTGAGAHEIIALGSQSEQECVTLGGNLCTAMDVIAKDITLPKLEIGDMVVITNAGSYAAAISPMQFSSQTPPAQLFLSKDGQVLNA